MRQDFLQETAKMNRVHRTEKRTRRTAGLISLGVVLATVSSLVLPAITMNRELICGKEEHTHSEECYAVSEEALCGLEEGHAHGETCYTLERGELVCEQEESEGHTHGDACYDPESHELICGLEESEGHSHEDACYEQIKTLTCELEEGHVHSEECYRYLACEEEEHVHGDECYREASDDTADLENREIWEKSLASATLTGDYAEDLLAIARTQLGYTESEKNFRYNKAGGKNGYTRYGEWYGDAYGDWCAMFISFCLRYANVPEEVIPSAAGCTAWVSQLKTLGRFADAGFAPRVGDLVFFDRDGLEESNTTHVGIVAALEEDTFLTVEGNHYDKVCCGEYAYDNAEIYGYGLLSELKDETKLTYEDENLSATLTLAPALSGTATLSLEKVDPKEDTELWKNMALPLVEAAQEEEEELDALDLYRFRVTRNGEELDLQDYELTLEAKAEKPVLKEETPEEEEGLRSYALLLLSEEELAALEAEKEEPEEEAEIDPIAFALAALLPADLEEPADEEAEEAEENEETFPAIRAEALENRDYSEEAELNYSGAGKVYGFALAALPKKAEALSGSMVQANKFGMLSASALAETLTSEATKDPFDPNVEFSFHKRIDWYGDNSETPATGDDMKYRLYLDAGALQYKDPVDMLIVVDRSHSMYSDMGAGLDRGKVVTTILNGATDEVNSDGLISKFLAMNPQNKVAVLSFFGTQNVEPYTYNADIEKTLDWTSEAPSNVVGCGYKEGSYTNYAAAYLGMKDMFSEEAVVSDSNKKLVIFLSDGVPTYYLSPQILSESYTRRGNGSPTEEANITECKQPTLDAFEPFFSSVFPTIPIYTIAVGDGSTYSFDKDILRMMSNTTGGTLYSADDYSGLYNSIDSIIQANAGEFKNLVISDTLTDFVDLAGNITVKMGSTVLYQRNAFSGAFTDTETSSACSIFNTDYLTSVAYSVDDKSITVTFNAAKTLDPKAVYELSFDVQTTASASITYSLHKKYSDMGDVGTDYDSEKNTSSEKPGFFSNAAASASYTYAGADKTFNDYPKPVVQVPESTTPGGSSQFTIHGYITQNKTIDKLADKPNKQNAGNADTDLDDGKENAALTDFYRLYLDAGQMKAAEPLDLLLILDKSNSMDTNSDVQITKTNSIKRYKAMDRLLNGKYGSEGGSGEGLIRQFLAMNENNRYAVISFGGARDSNHESLPTPSNYSSNWSYTKDTVYMQHWGRSFPENGKIDCTPNGSNGTAWGTNYSAAFYRAKEVLTKAATSGDSEYSTNKKLVIFISDGVPTFWMTDENTRYGNGSDVGETGSYDENKKYSGSTSTKEQNIKITKERIDELKNAFSSLGVGYYSIGVASQDKLDRTLLNYLCYGQESKPNNVENRVITSLDYSELLTSFEDILYGNTGAFRALGISDTLTEYVDIYKENADILITKTENGTTTELYKLNSFSGDFNHTVNSHSGANPFNKDYIESVSVSGKNISIKFKDDAPLERSGKYELSFNVQTQDKAYEEYGLIKEADSVADGYSGTVGDSGTDYLTNDTSSGHSGFFSNTVATSAYTLGNTAFKVPYLHPVVQVDESKLNGKANITITKEWGEGANPANDQKVTVHLYRALKGVSPLTLEPVPDSSGQPMKVEITKAGGKWESSITGLPRKLLSGGELIDLDYYIVEDIIDGYAPTYDSSVTVTINGKVQYAGKVTFNIPEGTGAYSEINGTAKVTNTPGLVLPATGGSGTVIFTVMGSILLSLAAVFFVINQKKQNKTQRVKRVISMKKIVTFMLALVLLLSLAVGVSAAEGKGSVTITNATIGQIYKIYKVFDATIYDPTETDINKLAIAYTYNGELPTEGNSYFSQDKVGNIKVLDAAKTSGDATHLNANAIAWLKEKIVVGKNLTPIKSVQANSQRVIFDNLDYGYYYVESTLGTAVTIDSTTPNPQVIDKNQVPDWNDPEDPNAPESDKTMDESSGKKYTPKDKFTATGKHIVLSDGTRVIENTADFEDTVTFETCFNATNYVGERQVKTYFIHDTICHGFDGITDLSVEVGSRNEDVNPITLTNEDYTVSYDDNKHQFHISIPWDKADNTPKYAANAVICITYKAKVNKDAVIAGDGNPNTTYFDYRLDNDTLKNPATSTSPDAVPNSPYHKSPEKETRTYVFAIGLTKVDSDTKARLKGAEFSITRGTDSEVIKAKATTVPGVYEYSNEAGAVAQFKTSDDGLLVIKGLEEGKYSITEKISPKGYNKLLEPITVELLNSKRTEYTSSYTYYFDASGTEKTTHVDGGIDFEATYPTNVSPLLVGNDRGVVLPVTGGMGTRIFYVAGGILAFAALVLIIAKRRAKSEK